ncbi:MAG: hypothetical protein HY914_17795 [Desulfomonile tiedjei]|nr:hypothetical protein [Desulfomonile tiedjei]
MTKEHIHELHQSVQSIAGEYTWESEVTLEMQGRPVLCVLGNAWTDSSCCGTTGCRFAYVPGFVVTLCVRQNELGQWISEVEPIRDEQTRLSIRRWLEETEMVQQVQFAW